MASIVQDNAHDTPQDTLQGPAQPVDAAQGDTMGEPGESAIGASVRDNTGKQGGEVIPQESHKMATYPTFNPVTYRARVWEPALMSALAVDPRISKAAKAAGVDVSYVYQLMRKDDTFKAAVEDARLSGIQAVEDLAMQHILEGIEEPVFYRDRQVGSVRKYPERLTAKVLDAYFPRYRQASQGSAGGPTSVVINVTYNAPPNHLASAAQASGMLGDVIDGELATGSTGEGDSAE
jgi:hypothetical protein